MNKLILALTGCLSLFFLIGPIGNVSSHADILLSPDQYDFGEVEVGNSSTAIVTITNVWYDNLRIDDISFAGISSSDFNIVPVSLPIDLHPLESTLTIEVTFTPSSEGLAIARLSISWLNGETGIGTVDLSGVGVPASPPPPCIADILSSFDSFFM